MDFPGGQCGHRMTLKVVLDGTVPVGKVSQGFRLALSQLPWKISANVSVLDTKSIYTQFLFSQGWLHINRATRKFVKLTIFL